MATSFYGFHLATAVLLLFFYLMRSNNSSFNSLVLFELLAVIADGVGRLAQARADSLEMALMACKIQYVGALVIPLIWVVVQSQLCGIRLPKALTWGLIGASAVIYGSVLTIGYSPLYYKTVSLVIQDGRGYLVKEYGFMHNAYIVLMLVYLIVIAVLAVCAIKKRKEVPYKEVFFACCAGCLTIVIYFAEKMLGTLFEWKPVVYIFTGIPMLIASDTFNMFDMSVCIASAVDRMNDYGYIVFDKKRRFITANQFAQNLFPEIRHWDIERRVSAENTNAYNNIASRLAAATSEAGNGSIQEINGKFIEITFRYMYYRGKKPVGYLIELMDKTEEYRHFHTVQQYNALLKNQLEEIEVSRKAAEKSREEADRANHAKSDFLSRMSHDIRTPINGIFGIIHIVEANLDDKAEVQRGLEKIKAASRQLELLLNDVLDVSRLESGKVQLVKEAFDLVKLLTGCIPPIQALADAKGVAVNIQQLSCPNPMVIGSPVYFQRVIMNILSNSVKYNRPTGTVAISCWEERIDKSSSLYVIVVQDTGVGMSQEFLPRIYEPFERAQTSDGIDHGGTGLGMAITRELIELMDGKIEIESELERGTTVTIRIPMEICQEIIEEETVEPEILRGTKALVAEDNVLNQEFITFVLKENGIAVDVVQDGKEALETIRSAGAAAYDFILMDVMMPRMDGLDAARAIRALPEECAKVIPIIAMTAYTFKQDIQNCLNAGMNDHIAKPLDIQELLSKLVQYRYAKCTDLSAAMPQQESYT